MDCIESSHSFPPLERRFNECGCVSAEFWTIRYIIDPRTSRVIDAPICDSMNTCFLQVNNRFESDATLWYTFCPECRHECVSVRFETSLSSLTVSTNGIRERVKAFVESSSVPLSTNWESNWAAEIQRNFVELIVQCESLHVEHYNQTPSISRVALLSNIGGQTGLWIGISFLSLMELVEVACRLMRHQFGALRQKIQKRRKSTKSAEVQLTE